MPKKKKCKKAKWLFEEALQIAEDRRETKGKGKGERKIHALDAEFQRIAKRDKKAFLSEQWTEIEEINKMGKTRDLFEKTRHTKGIFYAKIGTIKDKNGKDKKQKQKRLIKGARNTQKNCTIKLLMTQITTMVWSLTSWNVRSSGP